MKLFDLAALSLVSLTMFRAEATEPRVTFGPISVVFNTNSGTYTIESKTRNEVFVRDAHAEVGSWSFTDTNCTFAISFGPRADQLGRARVMSVTCERPGGPALLQEFAVYNRTNTFVVIRTGLTNTTGAPIRIKRFKPLTGGVVFPGNPWTDVRTLNPARADTNNIILTLKQDGKQRSLVLCGLNTAEFAKKARLLPENPTNTANAEVEATHPSGKQVGPGELFWPADTVYVDGGISDPSAALERYGQILEVATLPAPQK